MKIEKHIFFVRSDFQFVVCKGIISHYGLNAEDCYFVTDRNTKTEGYKQSSIYGLGQYFRFVERCMYLFKHYKIVKNFLCKTKLTVYMPFSNYYSSNDYYDYVFYEEGFSAYKEFFEVNETKSRLRLRRLLVFLISPINKQIRGYLMGFICNEIKPAKKTRLISFSENCYPNIHNDYINKIVISVPNQPVELYNIPNGSVILVMDRLVGYGRPFELCYYKECISKEINWLKERKVKDIYIKFHPADYGNTESRKWVEDLLQLNNINFSVFDGKLEYLALQNIGVIFLGTNSTILFYAPLLGYTNKSFSFYKSLAAIDDSYKGFIDSWGDFEKIFSKNVTCL